MDVKIRFLEVFCFRWSNFQVGTMLGVVTNQGRWQIPQFFGKREKPWEKAIEAEGREDEDRYSTRPEAWRPRRIKFKYQFLNIVLELSILEQKMMDFSGY